KSLCHLKVVLHEIPVLPVGDIHGRAKRGVESGAIGSQSEQKTRNGIQIGAGVSNQTAHIATTTYKAVGDMVMDQIPARTDAMLADDPRQCISEREQLVIAWTIGAASAAG